MVILNYFSMSKIVQFFKMNAGQFVYQSRGYYVTPSKQDSPRKGAYVSPRKEKRSKLQNK